MGVNGTVKEKRASLKRKRDNYARKLRKKKVINYLRSQLRTCTTHGLSYIVNTEIHWSERHTLLSSKKSTLPKKRETWMKVDILRVHEDPSMDLSGHRQQSLSILYFKKIATSFLDNMLLCKHVHCIFSFINAIQPVQGILIFNDETLKLEFSHHPNSISLDHSTPLVTSVEMDYFNWNVSYPAVSLCPMNKIEDDDLNILVNETLETTGEFIDGVLRTICSLSVDTIDVVDLENLNTSSHLDPKDFASISAIIFKKFDNNTLTTSTDWPISVEIAMTELGMCHVINSNVGAYDNPNKWSATQYVQNNINLTVYDKDFFIQIIDYADQFKIFIHKPNEVILSTTPSYTFQTKTFINFGLKVWSTKISDTLRSAPIHIRKCRFSNEPVSERYPVYSYNHCILECRIKMILALCECVPHFYRPLDNERVCSLQELQCFVQHKDEITKLSASAKTLNSLPKTHKLPQSARECNCLSECESDSYTKDRESISIDTDDSRIRISVSSFTKVRVVKDTILNGYDILLRCGGVINLCIGASIISLMELIIFSLKVVYHLVMLCVLNFHKNAIKSNYWNLIKKSHKK